jgi:hypothetical protein
LLRDVKVTTLGSGHTFVSKIDHDDSRTKTEQELVDMAVDYISPRSSTLVPGLKAPLHGGVH